MKKHNLDRIGAIFMLIITVIFWSQLSGFTKFATIFPKAIVYILGIASLALLIKSFIKPDMKPLFDYVEKNRVLMLVGSMVIWVSILNFTGFIVTSTIAYFAVNWILDTERAKRTAKNHAITLAIILVQVVGFYYVFEQILGVPLPHGFLY